MVDYEPIITSVSLAKWETEIDEEFRRFWQPYAVSQCNDSRGDTAGSMSFLLLGSITCLCYCMSKNGLHSKMVHP